MDAHVADLQVPHIVNYNIQDHVLNLNNAKTDDDENVEDDVKLPYEGNVRIEDIQQSILIICFTFLLDHNISFTMWKW